MTDLHIGIAIPDMVGEVHGWRAWRIIRHPRGPRLQSVTYATVWPTSTWCVAECRKGNEHRSPDEECTCGLYAARDREHLLGLGYNCYSEEGGPVVIGQVAFAGKVIPGTQGFRAEKGRIVKIEVPFAFLELAEPLEVLYGIEVVVANTLETVSHTVAAARDALMRRVQAEGGEQ